MNRKGIALAVAMIFIFVAFGLILFISQLNRSNTIDQVVVRENYRAIYLAKGAIQMAMLKTRQFPEELRDACCFFDAKGTIENMSEASGGLASAPDRLTVLGLRNPDVPGDWIHEGEFIRELQMKMFKGATAGWSMTEGLTCDGPFTGQFFVTELRFITRRSGNRNDAVKIKVWAREDSGKTVGEVMRSRDPVQLREGLKIEEVHEIILKYGG
ncbi:MAG: hypothetical protein PHW04_04580 [Candidatus Wallbacteria bacterium]|nr:hypothetical protein [Candidatus Wallbacteria bacterium]